MIKGPQQVPAFTGVGAVVVVGPLPPPAGGMANQTRQLVELLRSAQADVVLVQTNAPYRPEWAGRIPVMRAVFRLVPYLWSLWKALSRGQVMHLMANSGWAWHLFAAPAIWIAWLRGVPAVVNYRGGEADQFLSKSEKLVRFSMRRSARLIVPSVFLQEVFARYEMPAIIVPNIIDLERFHPRSHRDTDSAHLVVARNLEPLYDNQTALRAFQLVRGHYPHARLTIAGSGPEEMHLRQLAHALGLADSVRFAGRLDRDAMAELYRSADLMLNPSLADNMPNSILESMASGVPVVTTNVGGIPYIVQDGVNALLVPPDDPTAMATACRKILQSEALWQRLSMEGQSEVQRYTWERVAPFLELVYCQSITGSGKSSLDTT
jgi:glycosyltransferase involved in cell wall biosynthesis